MSKTPCVWEDGLAGEFWRNGRLPFTVYDVHGHMGLHPAIYMSHAAPETMVRHLRRAGAKLIFTHHYALNDWTFRNAACVEIARRFPDDLRHIAHEVQMDMHIPKRRRHESPASMRIT